MLSRRHLLLAAAQSALPSALAAAAPTFAADDFVESVGLNTHLSSGIYAARFGEVRALLGASGIRHVRDELRPSNDLSRWRGLRDAFGIRAQMLVSPATNTPEQMMRYLRDAGNSVSAIEGQNEGDGDWFKARPEAKPDWATATVAYQRAIHAALRGRYSAEALPLVSPSVLDWKPADMTDIRAAAPFCDIVAIHSYVQRAQNPETTDDYASLDWYLRTMRDGFKPGAPVMATETGYCTIVRPGASSVSAAVGGKYLPRLLLNNFGAGVTRSFLYEMLDEGPDPADGEQNYGLVRNDLTPKPAWTALVRLLGAMIDKGPAFAAKGLAFTVDGADASTRAMAFARRDGGFVIALWLAKASWNKADATDIVVPPRQVEVALGESRFGAVTTALDDAGGWRDARISNGRLALSLRDVVTLVKLTPR